MPCGTPDWVHTTLQGPQATAMATWAALLLMRQAALVLLHIHCIFHMLPMQKKGCECNDCIRGKAWRRSLCPYVELK